MTEIKSNFTHQEDYVLMKLVRMFGIKKWKIIILYFNKIFPEMNISNRIIKDRWENFLDPMSNNQWSLIEEYIFFQQQKIYGNKWAKISKFLPGRSDNNIKNHFYSSLRKNSKRILKKKDNYACIKDKMKAFYTMMFIKEKLNGMKEDILEDHILTDIINTIPISELDGYINKLCKSIINDEYSKNININYLPCESININNPDDAYKINALLKEIIEKALYIMSIKYIKNKSESNDQFEFKLTTSEKNVQERIDEYNDVSDNDDIDGLISNFISRDVDKENNTNIDLNNTLIHNFVENFYSKENNGMKKEYKGLNKNFKNTLENIIINNILSTMIQSNYSDYIYKYDIDSDNLNNLFKNYENINNSIKSIKFEDLNDLFLEKKRGR